MRSISSHPALRVTAAGVFFAVACSTAAMAGATCSCLGDLSLDGTVDGADITQVLGNWGTNNAAADLDDNGIVDGGDITVLLGNWGACAAPANDNCVNAQSIGPGVYDFCNVNATTDGPAWGSGECSPALNCHHDLWYVFTPRSDGVLKVTTCGSDFDTTLAIYGSIFQGLSPCPSEGPSLATFLGCDDDSGDFEGLLCGELASSIELDVVAEQPYKIRVGGYIASSIGAGKLHVEFTSEGSSCATPITTNFNDHQVIFGNTSDNPVDDGVPGDCFSGLAKGGMEWITYTNTCTGILTLSTCNPGTDYDTIITVLRYEFDGNCWSTFIECNDDFAGDPDCALPSGLHRKSFLQVPTSGGEVFRIVVSGFNGQSGNYELTIDRDCN